VVNNHWILSIKTLWIKQAQYITWTAVFVVHRCHHHCERQRDWRNTLAALLEITFLVWGWIGMFNERVVRTALLTPNQHNSHHLNFPVQAMVQFLEPN